MSMLFLTSSALIPTLIVLQLLYIDDAKSFETLHEWNDLFDILQ